MLNTTGLRMDKQRKKALKHTYQLRGMANTVRLHTAIPPGQCQPRTAAAPFFRLISMA